MVLSPLAIHTEDVHLELDSHHLERSIVCSYYNFDISKLFYLVHVIVIVKAKEVVKSVEKHCN
jgi:hypothetical protein